MFRYWNLELPDTIVPVVITGVKRADLEKAGLARGFLKKVTFQNFV
jgi:hypothetical protein